MIRHFINIILLGLAGIFTLIGAGMLFFITTPLPDVNIIKNVVSRQSIVLEDRNGEFLFDFSENEKRTYVPIGEISQNIINATIAIEDHKFYKHGGIRWDAFFRAAIYNTLTQSFSHGGSTITQQVIKNVFLTNEKKINRKIKELLLAPKLEKQLNKDKILEIYLNTIPFGGVLYGVGEASHSFFNKSASDLTISESAYLAAILNAPSFFSPYGHNKRALEKRKNKILELMLEYNFITREEYITSQKENNFFQLKNKFTIQAPHFVFYVKDELEKKYGEGLRPLEGQRIQTSLDLKLQKKVQKLIDDATKTLEKNYGGNNVATVVLSVKTGEIISLVGSKNYFDLEIDGRVNIINSKRQPGSTIKPIIYSQAFEKGLLPETILYDVPTQFTYGCNKSLFRSTKENKCYSPKNYTQTFVGPVSIRSALAQSINIPAVKTLYLANIKDVISLAKKSGITTLDKHPSNYGLSFALGSAEVKPIELAQLYSIFANDGSLIPYTWEKINSPVNKTQVISEQTSKKITDILSDNDARAPVFGYNSPLNITSIPVAVKTGTTNNSRDIWVVGYSPDVVVLVWHGNTKGGFLENNASGLSLSKLFRNIILTATETYGTMSFFTKDTSPKQNNNIPIISGKINEEEHTILHYIDKNNYFSQPKPHNKDPQYVNWEFAVQDWIKNNKTSNINTSTDITDPQINTLTLISPEQNKPIKRNSNITIITNILPIKGTRYEFYIENKFIGSSHIPLFLFDLSKINTNNKSTISISVTAQTSSGTYIAENFYTFE